MALEEETRRVSYWKNKSAIVTGGSDGLGFVLAQELARLGAQVVIAGRDPTRLAHAAERLRDTGGTVEAVPADVTRDADVTMLVQTGLRRFQRLDALFNVAGKSDRGRIADVSLDRLRELWELNFLATVRCTQAALPALMQRRGHVVNIGSLAAKVATKHLGAYPTSKFPLAAYSQQLRLELGPEGLHVLFVCPGPIAREDAGQRYEELAADLPEDARKPGGGTRLKALEPHRLARKILSACERRSPELVLPGKAKLLFALAQLCPGLADKFLR